MTTTDPWLVLGLPPGSSLAEARAARRRLAKQLHPDLHTGGPPAEQAVLSARMTAVNLALADIERTWAGQPAPVAARLPADPDSFSVECLPVDAFEALFLAAYGLGDILVTEEPYLLEMYLTEPSPCFCRLTLVPEAGASQVTVEVSPAAESLPAPQPSDVIEVLVAELDALVAR